MLRNLGLRTSIALHVLLNLASTSSTKEIRKAALRYFVQNFSSQYASEYHASEAGEIMPSQSGDALYRPFEIFTDPACSILGLPILATEWLPYAELFGSSRHPSADVLVAYMAKSPPSIDNASEIFAYYSKVMGGDDMWGL